MRTKYMHMCVRQRTCHSIRSVVPLCRYMWWREFHNVSSITDSAYVFVYELCVYLFSRQRCCWIWNAIQCENGFFCSKAVCELRQLDIALHAELTSFLLYLARLALIAIFNFFFCSVSCHILYFLCWQHIHIWSHIFGVNFIAFTFLTVQIFQTFSIL